MLYEGLALWAQPAYAIGLARQWFVLNAIFLSGKIPMVIENTCQCEGSIQSLRRDRVLFVFIHQVVHNYVNLSTMLSVLKMYPPPAKSLKWLYFELISSYLNDEYTMLYLNTLWVWFSVNIAKKIFEWCEVEFLKFRNIVCTLFRDSQPHYWFFAKITLLSGSSTLD